mgnify:FL=1
MSSDLQDLQAFLAVLQAQGFREAARSSNDSASRLSEAVRRLEERLGVRLFNRTTRRVVATEAGLRLAERLTPALAEVRASLDVVNGYRERPAGRLRINVPANVARTVLPPLVTPFLQRYPEIRLEVVVEDSLVDVLAAGCDAGIRYDERLAQDMVAVPIGPRRQSLVTAAAPAYLRKHGEPLHPAELLHHACLRGRFAGGALPVWEFEKDGEILRVDPDGPLQVRQAAAIDLAVQAAIDGLGIVHLFADWLRPHLDSGALRPILEPWRQHFDGPWLYYPGRRQLPAPLRAFVDFVREQAVA